MTTKYLSKDFSSLVLDLKNYVKTYHSDKFAYFNDASPDMLYLEMLAYVGDVLSFNTDKAFNESFRSTAQARSSLVRIANDLNFTNFGKRTSTAQIKVSIQVPFIIEEGVAKPDPTLLIGINKGMVLSSNGGVMFETTEEINFADPFKRIITPVLGTNNEILYYNIQKYAVCRAGITKTQRIYITAQTAEPFMKITINDGSITEIVSVIALPGNVYQQPVESLFNDPELQYHQVDFLTQGKKFVNISTSATEDINQGGWVSIPKRFIVQRDVNDLVTLVFGSSTTSFDDFDSLVQGFIASGISLNTVLNNNTLGEIPLPDTTLFIKYRTGGGIGSNVQSNQIQTIVSKVYSPMINTPNLDKLNQVRRSLTVINDLPAVGGREIYSNEEIRQESGRVYAAQDRGVVYEDIKALINKMPSEFGVPYRISYLEIAPRVANLDDIRTQLDILHNELLAATTTSERTLIIQQINNYLDNASSGDVLLPLNSTTQTPVTLSTLTSDLLQNTPSLWLGEKCRLFIWGIDENEVLTSCVKGEDGIWQSPNEILKQNIKDWLLPRRVIGDWIDIVDGRIVNIQIQFKIITDLSNKQEILVQCLETLKNYFTKDNWLPGQSIYLANVQAILQQIKGVVNVVEIKFYNIWGTDLDNNRSYSPIEIGRYPNLNPTPQNNLNNKYLINAVNNTIINTNDTMFEVKYPDTDITGVVI